MTSDTLQLGEWCRVESLTGDASQRRYSRLWKDDGRSAILVEYPRTVRSQLERDLKVTSWCLQRGLPVPRVLAFDLPTGRAVLEDLGVSDAEATLEAAPDHDRRKLLESLLEPLQTLAACRPEELPPWNPPLDRTRLRWELAGFELWYVRHFRSRSPSAELARWLDELALSIGNHPRRVCHRDYHLNNLLIRDDQTVGVIDIQDILVGPDTYDVVSLVAERAAVRLIPTDERDLVVAAWADRTAAAAGWRERAELVRLQRGLKVLGTFARFSAAGQNHYRSWMIELAEILAAALAAAGAPKSVIALLLD